MKQNYVTVTLYISVTVRMIDAARTVCGAAYV